MARILFIICLMAAHAAASLRATDMAKCDGPTMLSNANEFFTACEAGKGWNGTSEFVVSKNTEFAAQVTDALPGPPLSAVKTVSGYSDWMAGVVKEFGPKATVKVEAAGVDTASSMVLIDAVFMGYSDYVYALTFDPASSCKISGMRKIWNDGYAFKHMPPPSAAPASTLETTEVTCDQATMLNNTKLFFTACEAGQGWKAAEKFVLSRNSTFGAEVTDAMDGPKLSAVKTISGYTEWIAADVGQTGPKTAVTVKAMAVDTALFKSLVFAEMCGYSDYVYSLTFDQASCKIAGMRKIWNDGYAKANAPVQPSPPSTKLSAGEIGVIAVGGVVVLALAVVAYRKWQLSALPSQQGPLGDYASM